VSLELHLAAPAELDASTLYRILQLRVDVFVVEQQCPYRELDGRDLEPGTRGLWATDASNSISTSNSTDAINSISTSDATGATDDVLATLRILREDRRTARIGRVATAARARTGGIATTLMRRALQVLDAEAGETGTEIVLDAQTPLTSWYRRFGFEAAGPEFVEDGISHLPMRRADGAQPPARPH
jgi:ElaA protein